VLLKQSEFVGNGRVKSRPFLMSAESCIGIVTRSSIVIQQDEGQQAGQADSLDPQLAGAVLSSFGGKNSALLSPLPKEREVHKPGLRSDAPDITARVAQSHKFAISQMGDIFLGDGPGSCIRCKLLELFSSFGLKGSRPAKLTQ
jgi:hypothetical protein